MEQHTERDFMPASEYRKRTEEEFIKKITFDKENRYALVFFILNYKQASLEIWFLPNLQNT